jgi:hypothetical protein
VIVVSLDAVREPEAVVLLQLASDTGRPLLCFCPDMAGGALSAVRAAYRARRTRVVPVLVASCRGWRGLCQDVALVTGATLFCAARGRALANVGGDDLGRALAATLERGSVVLHGGDGEPARLQRQAARLVQKMNDVPDEPRKQRLSERIARLVAARVTVGVRGEDDEETALLHDLACSALHVVRHFIATGGVPGAGAAYLRCGDNLLEGGSDTTAAARALAAGLEAPARCLLEEAGLSVAEGLAAMRRDRDLCPDVRQRKLVNWRRAGLIEAVRVIEQVLGQAADAAAALVVQCSGSRG